MTAQTSRSGRLIQGASILLMIAGTTLAAAPVLLAPRGIGTVTVRPGHSGENEDGAKVKNDSPASGAKARISPKKSVRHVDGTRPDVPSRVSCPVRFKGKISGIDSSDTVVLKGGTEAEVDCKGGRVEIGSNSVVTVKALKGGPSVTVKLPGNTTVTVPPGSSGTYHT